VADELPAERCETCRFWRDRNDGEGNGWCRRYPPTPDSATDVIYALEIIQRGPVVKNGEIWSVADQLANFHGFGSATRPAPSFGDWCGEWQAKK